MRRHLCIVVVASVTATTTHAGADATEDHRALMVAGQVVRKEGKLARARELFDACAAMPCGDRATANDECAPMRSYCAAKSGEVAAEQPSLVVHVEDERGASLPEAAVRVDSSVVAADQALTFDPGHRVVRASLLGKMQTLEVELARGDARRRVTLVIDLRAFVRDRPVPWYVYALGIGSATSFTASAIFGTANSAQRDDLAGCRPTCDPNSKSGLVFTSVSTDVGLALGATFALGAFVAYLIRPTVQRTVRLTDDTDARLLGPRP